MVARMASKKKNPAAVELGRLGGLVRVPKGTAALSPAERKAQATKAAEARWGKKRKKGGRSK